MILFRKKNVAIKKKEFSGDLIKTCRIFQLQDLKQVSSWSSKERLTTQVTYDKETGRYTAVFNEKYIRVWNRDETDLDKVKRHKFNFPFHTILSLEDGSPVLVRQDGATASLRWALENRKTWSSQGILKPEEKLQNCQLVNFVGRTYLCALTKTDQSYNYLVVGLQGDTCLEDPEHATRIELKRMSEDLVGHVILQHKNNASLLTLWSHGRLYSYPLIGACTTPVPGILVSVVTAINTKHPVVMVALNELTIAAYGADAQEEGSVLLIYNVQFKLVQAVQKLKLYTRDAKLWRIEDKLLLAANRHLAIAPYRLSSQKIDAMLGSSLNFKANENGNDDNEVVVIQESTVAHWQNENSPLPTKIFTKDIPSRIAKQINVSLSEGALDAAIHRTFLPQLIESKDVSTIIWCLDNFGDLPDKLLMDLLSFCLRTPEQTFASPLQNGNSVGKRKSHAAASISRICFLDRLFRCTFSDFSLIDYLKSELNFNEILTLTRYWIKKLENTDDFYDHPVEPDDRQIYKWCSLLLDSHYQNYLLSQDPGVLEVLNKLGTLLEEHVS